MFKVLIEKHLDIIKESIHSDPKLLESLNYLIDNLSKYKGFYLIRQDIKDLGTASKGVYFMQVKNRFTDFDYKEFLKPKTETEVI